MKISRTEVFQPAPATGGAALLLFLDERAVPDSWLLIDDGAPAARGAAADPLPAAARAVLAVPGTQVAIHWLELADDLTAAQAAGAARLMLADASAEPLPEMHVAVGRAEHGRTPVAIVPAAQMAAWLAAAEALALDPDAMVPAPLLLRAPADGFVRRERGAVSDYRGPAAAFSLEPELAEALVGAAAVETIDEARFESDLAGTLAGLGLDLRQGRFARRRRWRLEGRRLRRIGLLALAFAALTLAVQVATILGYTFAADRLEAEAEAIGGGPAGSGIDPRPGFAATAAALFDAVRATPNVELTRLEYRPDGSLDATVQIDGAATLAALRGRLEGSGLRVEPGAMRGAGGRAAADLTVRPS